MQLHQLEHLIRAAGMITDSYEFIVVGSQSILGSVERPPVLPHGWEERLNRLQTPGTNGRIAYCIDVLDLFMSKCAANREKDRDFNVVLLRAGLVDVQSALQRVPDMPIDDAARSRMASLITRLATQAATSGPLTA